MSGIIWALAAVLILAFAIYIGTTAPHNCHGGGKGTGVGVTCMEYR